MDEIKYSKSLKQEKLIYNNGLIEKILGWMTSFAFIIWIPAIGVLLFYDVINGFDNDPSRQQMLIEGFISIILIMIGFFLLKNFLKIDKLVKVKGCTNETNLEIINQIANQEKWIIHRNNKRYFKAIVPSAFSSARQVFVLYSKDSIFINVTSFGLMELKSPFHFVADKKITDIIKDRFNEKISLIK